MKWSHLINITDYNISIQELIYIKVIVYYIAVSYHIEENKTISFTNFLLNFSDVTTSLCPQPSYTL